LPAGGKIPVAKQREEGFHIKPKESGVKAKGSSAVRRLNLSIHRPWEKGTEKDGSIRLAKRFDFLKSETSTGAPGSIEEGWEDVSSFQKSPAVLSRRCFRRHDRTGWKKEKKEVRRHPYDEGGKSKYLIKEGRGLSSSQNCRRKRKGTREGKGKVKREAH